MKHKSFTGVANARAAVAKSPAQGMKCRIDLDTGTSKDGTPTFRYFPVFTPTDDKQREIITKARFRCVD